MMTLEQFISWIADWMKREMHLQTEVLADQTFARYGMDSVHSTMLAGDLEELLSRRLPPTLAWDYPTPRALAEYLVTQSHPEASLLTRIDDLSEEELDRLIAERSTVHS
jgi:acyl carrier protein